MWTQDITREWENVMWRVYEYETGLRLRHKKTFYVADILSFNSLVLDKLIFEYVCDVKAVF